MEEDMAEITKTTGEHVGLPGDRVDYYPQAEHRGKNYTVVVLPVSAESDAWTPETAAKAAADCERHLRLLLRGPRLIEATRHALAYIEAENGAALLRRQSLSPLGQTALRLLKKGLEVDE
jgi:hypothetical protein